MTTPIIPGCSTDTSRSSFSHSSASCAWSWPRWDASVTCWRFKRRIARSRWAWSSLLRLRSCMDQICFRACQTTITSYSPTWTWLTNSSLILWTWRSIISTWLLMSPRKLCNRSLRLWRPVIEARLNKRESLKTVVTCLSRALGRFTCTCQISPTWTPLTMLSRKMPFIVLKHL